MIGTGLEQQVFYNTHTFRSLLDSLARPGKCNMLELPTFLGVFPTYQAEQVTMPSNGFALGAMLSLLDREVSFAIAAQGEWFAQTDPLVQWVTLRSNSRLAVPEQANFVLFLDDTCAELVAQLNVGTLLEPEASATVFLCVERLAQLSQHVVNEEQESFSTGALRLTLRGPGIEHAHEVALWGVSESMYTALQNARRSYPLGIDLYLVDAHGACIGLPRTTHLSSDRHGQGVKA